MMTRVAVSFLEGLPFSVLRLVIGGLLLLGLSTGTSHAYEVWVTDQSDSAPEKGGYLYVYDGSQLAKDPANAKPLHKLDLSQDINAYCEKMTGQPLRRPHMVFFTNDQSHALISFLSGQLLFMDAENKKPAGCISMGKNVHAAWPTRDQKMAVGANIPEKKFIRVWTNYTEGTFTYDADQDVLDLKALQTGERPDNAPICPITDHSSTYAFITLRGGGLLVADITATPMQVVASLSNTEIDPAGCGGYQVGDTMYINSGGGWPDAPLEYDVYALDVSMLPDSIPFKLISSRDNRFADSHGMVPIGRYLWVVDRAGNDIEVIDTLSNLSVNTINMVGPHSEDPAPDLIDAAPDGSYAFVGLRNPKPLTGNNPEVNNAQGSTPGVAVIRVTGNGKGGEVVGIAPISNVQDEENRSDIHGVAVRKK